MADFSKNISEDYKQLCEQLKFDVNLKDYKESLITWSRLDDILILKNQFFWINDYTQGNNIYVHPNAELVTGYKKEKFRDFSFVYSIIHPDDHDYAYEFSKRAISASKDFKKELLKDPGFASFSVDFRLRCRDGHFIRVNRHSCCFRTDNKGNLVYGLILFTDISQLKKYDNMAFSWFGNDNLKSCFNDLIEKYNNNHNITTRERSILAFLSDGANATEIAKKLRISVHTIISHRRNLLHKTGTKNTAELIKFALEKELL